MDDETPAKAREPVRFFGSAGRSTSSSARFPGGAQKGPSPPAEPAGKDRVAQQSAQDELRQECKDSRQQNQIQEDADENQAPCGVLGAPARGAGD